MAAVHVVNPGKRRKRKPAKKNATAAKGGAVATKKRKRRKAKANPTPVSNPKKSRRRRRKGASSSPRRRARRNPDGASSGGIGGMIKALQLPELARELGAGLGADLAMGFVVRRFGDAFGTPINGAGGKSSPYAGAAWTGKNYAWAAAAALGGGFAIRMMAGKAGPMRSFGTQFAREGIKSLIKRLFYTEAMGRSEWMQTTFGSAMRVMDDRHGNRWVQLPDGTAVAMGELEEAGHMGALVGADYYGELTAADYYGEVDDEEIVEAGGEPGEDDDADQGTVDARSIDAGAWDVEGPGRRYFPTRPNDVMASVYRRHSAYADR